MRGRRQMLWTLGIVLVLAVWFALRGAGPAEDAAQDSPGGEQSVPSDSDAVGADGAHADSPTEPDRTVLPDSTAAPTKGAGTGSLRIELQYADGDPGVDLVVEVAPRGLARDAVSHDRTDRGASGRRARPPEASDRTLARAHPRRGRAPARNRADEKRDRRARCSIPRAAPRAMPRVQQAVESCLSAHWLVDLKDFDTFDFSAAAGPYRNARSCSTD